MADLDADGRLDVVAAADALVSVLVNAGEGAFAPPVDYPITAGSTSIAIGDVDGDGRPDIVVGGDGGGSVELLLNTGGARFRNVALCLCGGLSPSVALGDLDGDGSTDVVVANRLGEDGKTQRRSRRAAERRRGALQARPGALCRRRRSRARSPSTM